MSESISPKLVLKKICDGYSRIEHNGGAFYYKHITLDDEIILEEIYQNYFDKARKIGGMTEEEKLLFLDENNLWTRSQENEFQKKISYVDSLKKTRGKLVIEQQKEQLEKKIKEELLDISEKSKERRSLIGETCELYADNKREIESIKVLTFKDKCLENALFSEEEFEELSNEELISIIKKVSEENEKISVENIKRVSVDNYFFNLYCLIDAQSSWKFFDKPVFSLTQNQSLLLFFARTMRSIRENHNIPKDIDNDYDKIIEYVDGEKKKKEMVEKAKEKEAFSVVGAKSSEMKKMGIGKVGSVTPFDMLKRSGNKSLSKKDFL